MEIDLERHERLVAALAAQKPFPHPANDVERLETHISSVLLAGDYAYKIKKPVDFGFLSFLKLADRKHFCEEEIRLNRRLAPQIYLDTVAITGTPEAPTIDGDGEVIDYAVKMRRFDQSQLLDKRLADGDLEPTVVDAIADIAARFHAEAAIAGDDSPLGTPTSVWAPVAQNFEQIRPLLTDPAQLGQLDRLEAWSEAEYRRIEPLLAQRKRDGFIRECHGDMHLGNITLVDGEVVIFDGIEFNDEFRWIDVISEMAFVTMDLTDRGHPELAQRLMNRYLENSGDYDGLALLRFYQVYRALVRAKIAAFRLGQELSDDERRQVSAAYQSYADLAESFTRERRPAIVLMRGVSASGKSVLSQALLERLGAIRIRSDRERKRLFANEEPGELNRGLYDPALTGKTYEHLLALARTITAAGYPVIVDATFLKSSQIAPFADFARENDIPLTVVTTQADRAILEQRLQQRQGDVENISDATAEVLAHQLATIEPVPPGLDHLEIDTGRTSPGDAVDQLLEKVRL